jgi:hypothetical protein
MLVFLNLSLGLFHPFSKLGLLSKTDATPNHPAVPQIVHNTKVNIIKGEPNGVNEIDKLDYATEICSLLPTVICLKFYLYFLVIFC